VKCNLFLRAAIFAYVIVLIPPMVAWVLFDWATGGRANA